MTCALVSLHYFPSWIYDKYPEAKKKGIRTWDPNSEVMQDLYSHEVVTIKVDYC